MHKKILALSIFFSLNTMALEINNDEPYIVKKGDTLWDISDHFLKDPWEWRKIWKLNPYIENPNLIYPDDIITLIYVDGKPEIKIEKKEKAIVKSLSLNDGIKETTTLLSDSLPSVDNNKIEDFDKQLLIKSDTIKSKVITSYSHKVLHYKGDKIIVSLDKDKKVGDKLSVLKLNKNLVDGNDINTTIYNIIGEVEIIEKHGDLFVALITSNTRDIKSGDLIEKRNSFDLNKKIFPSKPPKEIDGQIIFNLDRVNTYKNKIVILNRGLKNNLEAGNVVSINSNKKTVVVDKEEFVVNGVNKGYVFIYKVEDNFSYGIIVKNKDLIKVGDNFNSPF